MVRLIFFVFCFVVFLFVEKKLFSDDDDASFFSQSKRGTASVNWDVVADLGYGESLVVVGNQKGSVGIGHLVSILFRRFSSLGLLMLMLMVMRLVRVS